MSEPESYSYPRYLKAKESVDARSLNRRVWARFLNALPGAPSSLRIFEVGGGVGSTFCRLVNALGDKEIETHVLHYTIVDREPENIQAARERISGWAEDQGYQVGGTQDEIHLVDGPLSEVRLSLITDDLFAYADRPSPATFDAVIAQAVLDLLDLSDFFASLRPLLKEGGIWYLPIHFDGVTGFEPPIDRQLDKKIERLYHESMGGGQVGEGYRAHTGRRLLAVLREQGDHILSAGSSDWIVFPREDGYRDDEEYFLHHILNFIEEELSDHLCLEPDPFRDWIQKRRQQISDGELVYIAHQLDVLSQKT